MTDRHWPSAPVSRLRLRPQASANYVHQVTAVAQRDGLQLRKVLQHHRVATKFGAQGYVFQYLRNRLNTSVRCSLQYIERCFGVDKLGSQNQVDSAEGPISSHLKISV